MTAVEVFDALRRGRVDMPVFVLLLLVLFILALAIMYRAVRRRLRPHVKTRFEAPMGVMLPSIVGLTHGTLSAGNDIRILQNGSYFDELLAELDRGSSSIHFETFLWKPGKLSDRLTESLAQKASEGATVRVLLDYSGGNKLPDSLLDHLRESGCHVRKYHPYRLANLGLLNFRDHRKICVIDGRIAFTGGHCIVDSWMGDAEDSEHFRDISIRVEGPVVQQLQAAFSENWREESGELIAGEAVFPRLDKRGEVKAHLAYVTAAGNPSDIEVLHYLAIVSARNRIRIQNPYFLPDRELIDALVAAVQRGVDVRVMLPSPLVSDIPLVQHASHHHFGSLLRGGVRILEYSHTLLHQKVFTVDGCWSGIGSTNFDNRSFRFNDEVTMGIFDDGIARELEETFERDAKHCLELRYEHWLARSWRHKFIDGAGYLVREAL